MKIDYDYTLQRDFPEDTNLYRNRTFTKNWILTITLVHTNYFFLTWQLVELRQSHSCMNSIVVLGHA